MNKYLYPFALVLAIVGFLCLDRINWLALSLLFLGLIILIYHFCVETKKNTPPKEILEAAAWANVDAYMLRDVLNRKVYSYKWSNGDSESATYTGDFTESQYIDFVAECLRQKMYVKLISKE